MEKSGKYASELILKEQISSIAVALSKDGKIIYEKGFGTRNLATNEPVTSETIFGTASIMKSFTAYVIMKLVEEGKLQVEDAVSTHLLDFKPMGYGAIEDIKIHHLSSHTTGLASIKRKEYLANLADHIRYLNEKEWHWQGAPGEYICYNNDTFLLLGSIIEKVAGESYQEYINRIIFTPMQMSRTTYDLAELYNSKMLQFPMF